MRKIILIVLLTAIICGCDYFRSLYQPLKQGAGTLEGVVRNEYTKKFITGAKVTCGKKSAKTDNNGYYFIKDILPGEKIPLKVEKGDYEPYTRYVSIYANKQNNHDIFLSPKKIFIIEDTIWDKEEYSFTKDVEVNPGVTLKVKPGVKIKFTKGHSLIIKGKLEAGGENKDIIFEGEVEEPGAWQGIKIDEGEAKLDNCIIRYARDGVFVGEKSELKISNSEILKSSRYGIYLYASYAWISNNKILNSGSDGLRAENYADYRRINIIDTTIKDSGGHGINCIQFWLGISGCIIEGNKGDGICTKNYFRPAAAEIKQCTIRGNWGYAVSGVWGTTVKNCRIEHNCKSLNIPGLQSIGGPGREARITQCEDGIEVE
jgi:hypothetical protein